MMLSCVVSNGEEILGDEWKGAELTVCGRLKRSVTCVFLKVSARNEKQ